MSTPVDGAASSRWAEVLRELAGSPTARWAATLLDLVPFDGLSIATMGDVLASETISASDPLAARLDELQFDLGEGPCWDALSVRRPVLEADIRGDGRQLWPRLSGELKSEPISGVFAFPLILGPLNLGAMDFNAQRNQQISPDMVTEAQTAADVISRLVLRRAIGVDENGSTASESPYSRRVVHQATGAVIAQLRLSPADSYLLIQGRAFADGHSMQETAEAIVAGQIVFTMGDEGIEEHE